LSADKQHIADKARIAHTARVAPLKLATVLTADWLGWGGGRLYLTWRRKFWSTHARVSLADCTSHDIIAEGAIATNEVRLAVATRIPHATWVGSAEVALNVAVTDATAVTVTGIAVPVVALAVRVILTAVVPIPAIARQ
jgi:hypothetical protein